jgi:hypothetical protein
MPTRRLRKRLLDRLVKSANSASELGLALLMTAGVVHCGGRAQTDSGEGTAVSSDAGSDAHPSPWVEAAMAPDAEAARGPVVEAAVFPDAGSDAQPYPMIEAPTPAPDASAPDASAPDASAPDAIGPAVEAAVFPDAGSDAHPSPWVEAPSPK